ncbi:MAG: outer membrane beta-barrel protein [Erythrobacter sp.]
MKTPIWILCLGSTAMLAAPAAAQSDDPFTGFRLEVVGGYDQSRAGSSIDDDADEDNDESIEGFTYGAGAGYDFNAGGFVVGVETELTDSTAETDFIDGDVEGIGFGTAVNAGRDIYVGARVGALVTPSTLLYAKGGYTNARYNIEASFDGDEFRQSIDADGFRIGAGAEYTFGSNSFAKLEYRYSNYSDGEIDFEQDGFDDVDLGDIDLDRHQVMAGVGFRF